jgi:hypothetical protein
MHLRQILQSLSDELGCQCGAGRHAPVLGRRVTRSPTQAKSQSNDPHRQSNEDGDTERDEGEKKPAHYFSLRTPLNLSATVFLFAAGVFTAINSPEALLRFVHAFTPPSLVLS